MSQETSDYACHVPLTGTGGTSGQPMVKAEQGWKSFGKLEVLKGVEGAAREAGQWANC